MQMDIPELALSVRQPWAWAIIHGGKDVENRDWRKPNPGLSFRGRVAIHASSGMTQDEYDAIMPRSAPPIPPPHLLVRGAIIGHVQIMDIIRDPGRETITSPWFFGPVGLMLHDPVAIDPIPCSGALGFFKWAERRTDAGHSAGRGSERTVAKSDKPVPGTAEDAEVKREMGATAARRGKSEASCPYAVAGWAWRHWVDGYRSVRPQGR